MSLPESDQVEINIFGPGLGESSAVHVGEGQWIIIDSCIDTSTGQPAALGYLKDIGVPIDTAVKLVVATHWHDDHVRGLAQTFAECTSARFCSSAAYTRQEFVEVIKAFDTRHGMAAGSGTSEICRVLDILKARTPKTGIMALGVRKIYEAPAASMSHGYDCAAFSLSPSDLQFNQAVVNIAKLLPAAFAPKRRAPSPKENALSVATWISVGPLSMLFGADLEEHGKAELGWSAVLSEIGLPTGPAFFFKIPHHGSSNGYHPDVWAKMLESNPYAVLTPWGLNKGLPQITDVRRINGLTNNGYSTSTGKLTKISHSVSVTRILRYKNIQLNTIEPKTGHIRLRNDGLSNFTKWTVELASEAVKLSDYV